MKGKMARVKGVWLSGSGGIKVSRDRRVDSPVAVVYTAGAG